MPLDDLLEGSVVAVVRGETVGVNEATKRVTTLDIHRRKERLALALLVPQKNPTENTTHLISTMGVHLTSSIISSNVDVGLDDGPRDEDIRGRLEELNTSDSASGHGTSTVARLGAPRDGLSFLVTDQAVRVGRAPQAEV